MTRVIGRLLLIIVAVAASLAISILGSARAATNLPIACTSPAAEGQPAGACPAASQVFAEATGQTLVRACNTVSCTYAERVWLRFANVSSAQFVEICAADKPPSSVATDCQGTTATTWGGMGVVSRNLVSQAVEPDPSFPGTFSVTPSAGVSPLSVTISWNISLAGGSCSASGSWSGAKPLQGSQVTSLTSSASYTLTCSRSTPGSALLSWTPPTQNTDGTPLTDLSGFRAHWGASPSALTQTQSVPGGAAATSYTVNNLNAGTWYFGVKAYASTGVESALSNVVSKVVAPSAQSYAATRAVIVSQVPQPPVLKVTEAQVFNAMADYALLAFRPSVQYGSAPIGTPCDSTKPVAGGYFPVPIEAVRWASSARTKYPVAKCGGD